MEDPHATGVDDVPAAPAVDPDTGLSHPEMLRRRERHGRNAQGARREVPAMHVLLDQVRSTVVVLPAVAPVAGALIGE